MFIYSTHTGRCRHFGSFGAENFGNESFLRLCSGVGIHVKLIFLRWLIGDESLVAVRIRLVAAAVHMGLDLFGDDDENRNEMKTNINQIEEPKKKKRKWIRGKRVKERKREVER